MKKAVALLLCVCGLSALLLTSCQGGPNKQGGLNKKEHNFVNCYNTYVKDTLENSDTVVIKRILETVDANGGTLVYFTYEYTTDAGYKTSRSLYIVTNKITIDSSLITLSEFSESMYGDEVVKLNGRSVDKGFVAEKIQPYSNSKDENMQIISLWKNVQSDYLYRTVYDIDVINDLISN